MRASVALTPANLKSRKCVASVTPPLAGSKNCTPPNPTVVRPAASEAEINDGPLNVSPTAASRRATARAAPESGDSPVANLELSPIW